MAAYWSPELTIAGAGADPQKVRAATCTDDLFTVLGVLPMLGRPLTPTDGVPGSRLVTVLSHGAWQRRFGGDTGAIGKDVLIDGTPAQVVGAMPPGFDFPAAGTGNCGSRCGCRGPSRPIPPSRRRCTASIGSCTVVGRLRPGVSPGEARAELAALGARLQRSFPEANRGFTITAIPLQEAIVGSVAPPLWILFATVGCVLLVACANVGGLLLVRASARAREVTIRMALGAGRGRLVRQMLTESLVLASAGGALALIAAWWALDLVMRFAPDGAPHLDRVRIDGATMLFTGVIAVACPACSSGSRRRSRFARGGCRKCSYRPGEGACRGRTTASVPFSSSAEIAMSLVLLICRGTPGPQPGPDGAGGYGIPGSVGAHARPHRTAERARAWPSRARPCSTGC